MPGFGIQKRGTSPLLVKRKGFDVGGDVDSDYLYQGKTEEGTKVVYGEKPSKDLLKETEKIKPVNVPDKRINLKPDKNVKPTKALIEESDLSKEKPPKEEEKLQFRCAGPNPSKKCGHRDEKKKGGMVKDNKKIQPKKGILIIIGTKDKESKKMKKGMHKMPNGKMMKNSDMKKK